VEAMMRFALFLRNRSHLCGWIEACIRRIKQIVIVIVLPLHTSTVVHTCYPLGRNNYLGDMAISQPVLLLCNQIGILFDAGNLIRSTLALTYRTKEVKNDEK
jgi:hypothetical protein